MKEVMFKVPLNKLYKLIASCYYNEFGNFCPVLVKIVDDKVLEENRGKEFLLQVWDRQGEMVFERPLKKPVVNWNISDDIFIFIESNDNPVVHVVKLYLDKTPVVFKFNLPKKIFASLASR